MKMAARLRNYFSMKNYQAKDQDKQTYSCNIEDYDRTYDIPRFIFKTIGIRVTYKDSEYTRLWWNVFFWVEFGSLVIGGVLEMLYMYSVAKLGTFEAAIGIFTMMPCLGYGVLGFAKIYKIVYYRPIFEGLIDELREQWPRDSVTEEEYNISSKSATQLAFVIKGYYWCNMIMTVLYMAQPCVAWLKHMLGYDTPRVLPFFFWFPFDPYQPYLHEFLMILQIWQGYVAVMYLICGDMMFCIFLSHIATQFDLLSCRIRRLVYVPVDDQLPNTYPLAKVALDYSLEDRRRVETYSDKEWEIKHHKDLIEIINRHRDLIRLAGDVETLYSFSLLLNFGNSSIVICFCGFCCVMVEKLTEVVYKIFLVTALVQTWLLCWYGQRLLESSEEVSNALYNSGWYRASRKIRTTICIMIIRSQKAVTVTTYGFSVVCLASFTTTYSCNIEDYDRTYDIPRFIFKTIGIRVTYKDSEYTRLWWNVFFWVEFGSLVIGGVLEMLYMYSVAKLGTFEAAIGIFTMMPCLGYGVLGFAKIYKIVYYRPIFEGLIDELREQWPRDSVTEEEYNISSKSATQLAFVIKGYYWCNMIMTVLYMAQPCVAWLKHMLGYDTPRVLPFFFWFPFDPYQPYLHEFLMILQIWQGYVAVMYLICGDMMFCIFLSHIATQFDLLSCRIRRLVYVPVDDQLPNTYPLAKVALDYSLEDRRRVETYSDKEWEIKHHKDLIEIINRHRDLIRLAGDVETLYSFSLLLNFGNSSIVICFCGFCCVMVEKLTEMVYKIFLVTALVQTWLLCWYGQRLLESSEEVSNALYNSGWYRASRKIRTIICIMIIRSQKAVTVTTYGFSVVCLASFTTIIKTAWSYFTLLLNIYK